ncbi:MAG: cytochrome c oxidase subunit 4, partial [Marmoricola sp.]|nr:cytochrome c oxidase subunit 4 [Marmoricola sp.]
FYLGFHARKITASGGRPEDRNDAEIADGAGELGFFPPYSWWPFWCGLCLASMALGVAVGWWLFIIGGVLGVIALCGLIFEYYRGAHAH